MHKYLSCNFRVNIAQFNRRVKVSIASAYFFYDLIHKYWQTGEIITLSFSTTNTSTDLIDVAIVVEIVV